MDLEENMNVEAVLNLRSEQYSILKMKQRNIIVLMQKQKVLVRSSKRLRSVTMG